MKVAKSRSLKNLFALMTALLLCSQGALWAQEEAEMLQAEAAREAPLAAPAEADALQAVDAVDEAPEAPAERELPAGEFGSEGRITVALDDIDLSDVVQLFIRLADANIICNATNLQGSVTANLQDVEWEPAFRAILERQGLMLQEDLKHKGIYYVDVRPPAEEAPWITETFKLDYLKSSEAAEVLTSMLGIDDPAQKSKPVTKKPRETKDGEPVKEDVAIVFRKDGRVVSYPSGNMVVVSTTEARMEEVRQVLQKIDLPRQQVYIEAKIVELRGDASKKIGLDWSMLDGYRVGIRNIARSYNKTKTRGYDNLDNAEGSQKAELARLSRSDNMSTYQPRFDGLGQPILYETTYEKDGSGNMIPIQTPYAFEVGEDIRERDLSHTHSDANALNWGRKRTSDKLVSELSTAIFEADALSLVLSALQTSEDAFLVSNPKIIVANEERAMIDMATKEPYVTVERKTDGTGENTTYTFSTKMDIIPGDADENKLLPYIEQAFFTYGIKLEVTPRINNASNITVTVSPTLSSLIDYYTPGGAGSTRYPRIQSKHVKTIFSLGNGQTAVIGGLTTTSDNDVVKKIPLLGDIPLIGKYLFSHSSKIKEQRETIIFVTVGIIDQSRPEMAMAYPEASTLIQKRVDADGRLLNKTTTPSEIDPEMAELVPDVVEEH